MQGMSIKKEAEIAPDHAIFSWMEGEDILMTNDATSSSSRDPEVKSNYNLRLKRRLTGENVSMPRKSSINSAPE